MNDTSLLEDALLAYLNRRCRRAYAHDLRNGLQGIFGGVDALTRAARATKPPSVPLDQLTSFVQQAIVNHEHGLEHVLESMAPDQHTPALVSLRQLVSELARFMANDAARNNVRVRLDFDDDLQVTAALARLRSIALGLLTESIDSMPGGGEIRISGRTMDGRVHLQITDFRPQPRPASLVNEAIQRLVTELSGCIESKQGAAGEHEMRVELPVS